MKNHFPATRGAPKGKFLSLKRLISTFFRFTKLDLQGIQWRFDCTAFPSAVIAERRSQCSERLLDLALVLIERTRRTPVPTVLMERGVPEWISRWPGEHYRLLTAIVQELAPQRVVEIGTFTGVGSMAIAAALPAAGKLTTFDIVPWSEIAKAQGGANPEPTCFRAEDFTTGTVTQVVADLADVRTAQAFAEVLRNAEFIFVDGPKDGVFERRLLDNLRMIGLRTGTLLMFDDIRLLNMVEIWDEITLPKLDLTGFGHFTGTGLVEWQ
jgi:predicted O-methyltransferase YrrM